MPSPASDLRGIAAMVLATGFFVVNDSFMKLAAAELPPFEVLFLRGAAAAICCGALLAASGHWRGLAGALSRASLLRGAIETAGVLCYIVALVHMPIADVVAIGQTAPLIMIGLVWLVFRERIGPAKAALVLLGFAGAVLVAQPGPGGLSLYAVLAFGTAVSVALRDLVGKRVPAHVPAFVVTFATILIVMVVAGIATTLTEDWVMPHPSGLGMLMLSGLFVTLGHCTIFLAYRAGSAGAVAPFYYSFTVWALAAGFAIWREVPNTPALAGIALILASGLAIVFLDRRRMRQRP